MISNIRFFLSWILGLKVERQHYTLLEILFFIHVPLDLFSETHNILVSMISEANLSIQKVNFKTRICKVCITTLKSKKIIEMQGYF